jgi:hypothetical protein
MAATGQDLVVWAARVAFGLKISARGGKESEHRRLAGAEARRGFTGPFVQIRTGSKMIAAFGDDEIALVACDTETGPVKVLRRRVHHRQ